ncbi:MAG: hypothetical protein F6K22_20830 [Okeania sp. SIO2F4]|nr:hypothetical protein [Okeania sp. SIO2F4]NES05054.1 hypothetical protein [Okeania sp. SIO2F4]
MQRPYGVREIGNREQAKNIPDRQLYHINLESPVSLPPIEALCWKY